ncbi:MAG TPA: tRNA lysidine(34) synthetase TilS, partial [Lachnospiraceae bacterium]|nr:tRNA lysidine(34) synthetase TilS [Lachnospiraceae bacterium]
MLNRIQEFIEENRMLMRKDKVVIGVSGGADSVCLLFVLLKMRERYDLELHAVHVNHQMRGEEADGDEAYVKELCEKNSVAFHLIRQDVSQIARELHLSEEESGRMVRYEAFEEVCKEYNCNRIAIAHNLNDCAETMLFQLFRGSGLKGLSSIQPVRDKVIRPLLSTSRKEIEAYLKECEIPYRTDCTNLTDHYTRNKIRLNIIPYVENSINEQATAHIVKSAQMIHEAQEFIDKQANNCYNKLVSEENGRYSFDRRVFLSQDIVLQKAVIRKILQQLSGKLKDIESIHVEDVIKLASNGVGKRIDLPYGIKVVNGYESMELSTDAGREEIDEDSMEVSFPSIEVKIPGEYAIPQYEATIRFFVCDNDAQNAQFVQDSINQEKNNTSMNGINDRVYKKSIINPRNGYTKCFDYDKIKNAVLLRTRQDGDYMQI